jgi:mRNA-degrading endonuclease toxin of MazEF toxin-antitoxin module
MHGQFDCFPLSRLVSYCLHISKLKLCIQAGLAMPSQITQQKHVLTDLIRSVRTRRLFGFLVTQVEVEAMQEVLKRWC